MRKNYSLLHQFISLALLLSQAKSDPDPLQDYCVADTKTPRSFYFNSAPCINPELAVSSHFTTSVLSKPGNTRANPFGFNVTLTNTANLPGLNTLGLTMARVDIATNGLVPPHIHPRASEGSGSGIVRLE
ncbi:germin-like protein subfamily 1 member 1 isoform X2 [Argentina anserina]|uniref:germin-like protein subfamily 1 member 1 isoform X2 n=1 Tax=Argentina anserina TaxID=57926 RepID=UPI0021768483|nr:germin-like protein subfamily 1 member 1 isoform X2 [Potentilla anserina]